MQTQTTSRFLARLRQDEVSTTVTGTWPQLVLGQVERASTLTLGIDPAARGKWSVENAQRDNATEAELEEQLSAARSFFDQALPPWFESHEPLLEGMGVAYASGATAHADLVQEKLIQPWSDWHGLNAEGADALLRRDLKYTLWLIEAFPITTVVCTSRMVLDNMLPHLGGRPVRQGAEGKLRWMVAQGVAAGRTIAIVGWNMALPKLTEFDAPARRRLGKTLRRVIEDEIE